MNARLVQGYGEARALAAEWQSPGSIGSVIASFASGRNVHRYRLADDVKATQREAVAQPGAWEELEALHQWVLTNDEHVLIGPPHEGIRVITNHHVLDVIRCWDLTVEEWHDVGTLGTRPDSMEEVTDEQFERQFVRYRGWVYDLGDTDGLTSGTLRAQGWDSYASDSFFSGTVFRFFDRDGSLIDDGDGVVVGRYITD